MNICKECLLELTSYGELCSNLFLNLILQSEWMLNGNESMTYLELGHEGVVMRFLEKKGYVITTECGNEFINAIPNMTRCFINEIGVCCWNGTHKKISPETSNISGEVGFN